MAQDINEGFKHRVYTLVAQIPEGKVMSYGQIAALAGNPQAARIVGGIAHFGDLDLPWQRVVKKDGGLASGYPGGVQGHKEQLEAEGIAISNDLKVDINKVGWNP
jgi:methylated-DNA-protein-cysteine methyltransferase related protein